ncbi:MAG TPA: thermonuclease family protein [Sphingomicrobium sp.]|nr:thermonuclease family protein [Sphingomicrobium sp.]
MANRNDSLAPFDRREARKWTRVADYWPEADAHIAIVSWAKPGSVGDYAAPRRPEQLRKASRRALLLPIVGVLAAALLSLWGSGVLQPKGDPAHGSSAKSSGLVFGLCSEGGVTNCVASGDSFYLGGKTVRIAGIEAPQLYGAACPKEVALGRQSAGKLRTLLNSGEIETTKVSQDLDRYGLLLRSVSVNGKDVGQAMMDAGLARGIGDLTRNWC